MMNAQQKICEDHLKRKAYLYIRQSSVKQLFENTESTKRQYGLRQRAMALGWPDDQIVVIDSDQGQSGASVDREGFAHLVSEVGLGRAGVVMGLEVSRLARNSIDWHRLLEICALTDTLILDEDGIYDPGHFNDRLLLGLKGTMSEAELHVLRARLNGGILNKARRGELKMPLPVGLVYDHEDLVVLDPDQQVQQSVCLLFESFRRTGSALAVVKRFRDQGLKFPRRLRTGPNKGELLWGELEHSRVLQVLHNPRYAGAFVFGRSRQRKKGAGKVASHKLAQDQWRVLIKGAHEGYISWEEYQHNQQTLLDNAKAHGNDRRQSPPREGPALLQGIAVCGICGNRMTVRYHTKFGRRVPDYVCQRHGIQHGQPICQSIPGGRLEDAVSELLVQSMTPVALEVALNVQKELATRIEEADRLRRKQVERARYQAELAGVRYMKVDPNNRLVADSLEADWNDKLRALAEAQEEYEQQRQADRMVLSQKQQQNIIALATDFPKLWNDLKTTDKDKKRMVRLMIEDVTLLKGEQITAHVRFKGGATRTITLSTELPFKTKQEVVEQIDKLIAHHTDKEIAKILNQQGLLPGRGNGFNVRIIARIKRDYALKSRYDRLRDEGWLTAKEIASLLGVHTCTVNIWRRHGLLEAKAYNDKREYLYNHPGEDPPSKAQGRKLSKRRRFPEFVSDRPEEVQYET